MSGQLTLDGTTQQLIDPTDLNDVSLTVVVKALAANTQKVYLGPSGVTAADGLELAAGDFVSLDMANPNDLYVIGTNLEKVGWLALLA